jgi:phosphoribosylglycinamide formyltransferase-1
MADTFSIVVLISGNGSNLQAIIDSIAREQWPIEIKAVISNQSSAYGLQRAHAANIAVEVIERKQFTSRAAFDHALQTSLQHHNPDLIVLAGFMHILAPEFVQAFNNKLINIHPSLLPKFKGLNTHQRALDAAEKTHGCSVHYVTTELDAGQVIAQAQCDINTDESADSLQQKVHALEHELLPKVIHQLSQNTKNS